MTGQPTYTRAEIRKDICRKLGMSFFKLFDESAQVAEGCTTRFIVSNQLTQGEDYWKNYWFMMLTGDEAFQVRRVIAFAPEDDGITLDRALTGIPTATETFQLFNIFSPYEIHNAINEAIEDGYPAFCGIILDDSTLVVQEDTLEYALSGLSTAPWRVYKVWIEQCLQTRRGKADSSTNTTLTDADLDITDVDSNWKISIYDGTGKGQLRNVSSAASGGIITISAAWTTNPDTTSKYCLWNPTDQRADWMRVEDCYFDMLEYPSKMFLSHREPSWYGMRMRIQYSYEPSDLSSDSATTVVPKQFIHLKARSILFFSKANDTRMDQDRYTQMAVDLAARAEEFKQKRSWNEPSMTIFRDRDLSREYPSIYPGPDGDALGWNG